MRPTARHIFTVVFLSASLHSTGQAQQPFHCDGQFYLALPGTGPNSKLLRISKDSSLAAQPVITTIADNLGLPLTALGFNGEDMLLYGLDKNTHDLVRIGADGTVVKLGVPENLDPSLEYLAGEARPQGGGLYVVGAAPGGSSKKLYTINLEPPYYAGLASIISDEPVRITDIAFDPVFGTLVGFDEIEKKIVHITVGGLVTSIHYVKQPQLGALGALFFDRWGLLYGHDGSGSNSLHLFNKFNGKVTESFSGPSGSNGDGCSCPYRIRLFKRIAPQIVVPCSEVTVTYTFHNTAATAYGQKTFVDEFPTGFTITEIVRKPYSTVVSGVGTNRLELSGMEVLLDLDSIVIKVDVGDVPGEYPGQALASGFPLSLGVDILSDNPATPVLLDPTPIIVADTGELILQKAPMICPGGTVQLAAAANGLAYQWSDGSTASTLDANTPGLYWVEITGICGAYRDSVWVEMAPPPWVDLGEDRSVPFGHELQLAYTTNLQDNATFFWQANGATLDCQACPHPTAKISNDATFSVTVTDGHGCTASDDLSVGIEDTRLVYFPNAFSPNNDGINDVFYPQALGQFFMPYLRVYDRWGGLLFEKTEGLVNDATAGWDGMASGKLLPEGVYLWEAGIGFGSGGNSRFSGSVLILR